MQRRVFLLPQDIFDKAAARAMQDRISISEVYRRALHQYLSTNLAEVEELNEAWKNLEESITKLIESLNLTTKDLNTAAKEIANANKMHLKRIGDDGTE